MTNENIGSLGRTPVTRNNLAVSETEPTDVFQFQIGNTRNVNLSLTNISAGNDPDLRLYRDNGNGIFDSGDQLIDSSVAANNRDDSINRRVEAGTYFAEVSRYAGVGSVSYDFSASATTPNSTLDFSNLLPREFELGNLSTDITRTGRVGDNNTADTYSFSLGSSQSANIILSGLTSDADIRLIRDSNNNHIVDAGDEIRSSTRGGTASDQISNINQSGEYYLQVNQYTGQTSYTLTFDNLTSSA
jgi:Bacterial pre-peptidase C-terminal domain